MTEYFDYFPGELREGSHRLVKRDDLLTIRFDPLFRHALRACLKNQDRPSATSAATARFRMRLEAPGFLIIDLGTSDPLLRARVVAALRALPFVRFVARALTNEVTAIPVIYTGALYVQYREAGDVIERTAALTGMTLSRLKAASFADHAFIGYLDVMPEKVFALANTLIHRPDILFATPEVCFYHGVEGWVSARSNEPALNGRDDATSKDESSGRAITSAQLAAPQPSEPNSGQMRPERVIHQKQWHLRKTEYAPGVIIDASASVADAHRMATGKAVTIAVIDQGVDHKHPEFRSPGKIVDPQRFSLHSQGLDVTPRTLTETHGTAVAGVACADGAHAACGVAPDAKCMPIAIDVLTGSLGEALAFDWARRHNADVIVCSWGPGSGDPADAYHPRHYTPSMPMPSYTREAISRAATTGRRGAGCAIFFAAGNNNDTIDHQPYATNPAVFAIGACNEYSERTQYSAFGEALFCVFPSNDMERFLIGRSRDKPLRTAGIWTPAPTHSEYWLRRDSEVVTNAGVSASYTDSFGGTSSAAPGAAGVAALVLELLPDLPLAELRLLLAQACDRIDEHGAAVALPGPVYDRNGHSHYYGFGRINARRAVQLAQQRKSFVPVGPAALQPDPSLI